MVGQHSIFGFRTANMLASERVSLSLSERANMDAL